MVFILFNIANSFKFISKYGVFHLRCQMTASYTQPEENKLFGELFLLDIIYEFSKNDFKTKKYVVMKALEILKKEFFQKGIKSTKNNKYLNIIINKIINCKYISNTDKNIIIKNYNFVF